MAHNESNLDSKPIISLREDFDHHSGSILERFIFNNRIFIVLICLLLTIFLGIHALKINITASYTSMMPQSNPFIKNYMHYSQDLHGLGNSVRIVVQDKNKTIYNKKYLALLQKINQKVYLLPGVDRSFVRSLWMPVVRWTGITPQGYVGGPVMPDSYNGSAKSIKKLKDNVSKAGIVGSLVGTNQKSSMILLPLLNRYGETGKPLNYKSLTKKLDSIRSLQTNNIKVHIIGFAELMGDLIRGTTQVAGFFLIAAFLAGVIIYFYTSCLRCAIVILACTSVAVTWQLGILQLLSYSLDPYSVLVPFLIFAIGISHGSQKMNGITQDIGRGTHRYVAARYTFRRLFIPGLTAILADAVGFGVLSIIDIPAIRDLAKEASIGVALLIFTNLILLPIILSYTSVGAKAAKRSIRRQEKPHRLAQILGRLTQRRWAVLLIALALVITGAGLVIRTHLQIGDSGSGAPELWPNSRYNQDVKYISNHYDLSGNRFIVIVQTKPDGLTHFKTLIEMDRLEQRLRALPDVLTTVSAASLARRYTSAEFSGNPKWMTISRNIHTNAVAINDVYDSHPALMNLSRSIAPIVVYLKNHRAQTLKNVVATVNAFNKQKNTKNPQFLMAAGRAGVQAAVNESVGQSNLRMLLYVYAAVILLCLITFRSWRATIVAIVPLVVTSILCDALMVILGIGVTVATLPVTALGVGIGVDYALYLLSVQLAWQRAGLPLEEAFRGAFAFTGRIVALVGTTLAAAVITWAWSPIKFQANMGILLAFMFLWNMLGALVLLPSLSAFLLSSEKKRPGGLKKA